jgi:hypothetical protein
MPPYLQVFILKPKLLGRPTDMANVALKFRGYLFGSHGFGVKATGFDALEEASG